MLLNVTSNSPTTLNNLILQLKLSNGCNEVQFFHPKCSWVHNFWNLNTLNFNSESGAHQRNQGHTSSLQNMSISIIVQTLSCVKQTVNTALLQNLLTYLGIYKGATVRCRPLFQITNTVPMVYRSNPSVYMSGHVWENKNLVNVLFIISVILPHTNAQIQFSVILH